MGRWMGRLRGLLGRGMGGRGSLFDHFVGLFMRVIVIFDIYNKGLY